MVAGKVVLDYTLVPFGIAILAAYHAWLFHLTAKHPGKTVIGLNAINRRLWVQAMTEDIGKNGVLAVQTLRNNIMASTLLATTAIMLSYLIGILMANTGMSRLTHSGFFDGDGSDLGTFIKYFSILLCFLLSFLMNVQSIRYYSHASILINVPLRPKTAGVSREYVMMVMNRGGHFWSAGLRAFYFSLPMLMWLFGPVPMFVCCILLVSVLYFLDVAFDVGAQVIESVEGDIEEGNGEAKTYVMKIDGEYRK